MIKRARFEQLEKVGTSIGNAVRSDLKVGHMPVVRVLPKPVKSENNYFEIPASNPQNTGTNGKPPITKNNSSYSVIGGNTQ